MRGGWTYLWVIAGVAVAAAGIGSRQAAADTLEWALVQAYQNNPSLNAQRAAHHATNFCGESTTRTAGTPEATIRRSIASARISQSPKSFGNRSPSTMMPTVEW
jgi:hypothetical protein